MYYVTDLVKFPKFRKLLAEVIPKPAIAISDVESDNEENPSLTGNSFETLFSICQLDKTKFQKTFESDFDRADIKLARLSPDHGLGNTVKNGKLLFGVQKGRYNQTLSTTKKVLKNKQVDITRHVSPVPYFEISTNLYLNPSLLMEVTIKTGLNPFNPLHDIKQIVVFDSDSCTAYLKEIPKYFIDEITGFYKSGKCTQSFVKAILYFTQISHPFASHYLHDILFFSEAYLKKTTRQFQHLCKAQLPVKGKLTRTPTFDLLEIRARPDFLISKKLYEIKACKKFTRVEYMQALTYLIFAQHPENKKIHGVIKSIILYYVLTNQQIEIKSKDLTLDEKLWKKLEVSIRSFKAKRKTGK